MASGRLRTVSFSDDEFVVLGEEMIKWVTENYDSILHLSQWYTIHKGFTYNEWKTFLQKPVFLPYYEQALKLVGLKYIDKKSDVREGISQRWQRVYFGDLKESEDADADAEAERKAKAFVTESKVNAETQRDILQKIKETQEVPK